MSYWDTTRKFAISRNPCHSDKARSAEGNLLFPASKEQQVPRRFAPRNELSKNGNDMSKQVSVKGSSNEMIRRVRARPRFLINGRS